MKRADLLFLQKPLFSICLFIPLLTAGLLLGPHRAAAQIAVTDPSTPAARALTTWFPQHIPAKFQGHDTFQVQLLSDADMQAYLSDGKSESGSSHSQGNSHSQGSTDSDDDNDEIDGVFVNDPPQIVLRVAGKDPVDFFTFAHEYGHYVWFDLLTSDERKRYKALYEKQKAAHKLVTDYSYESVEEGFAEAFATDINDPAALKRQDFLSYQFLTRWPAAVPAP